MHKLTIGILVAMALGILTGLLLNLGEDIAFLQAVFTEGIFEVLGRVFIALLMVLVVPVVVVSLVCGIANLNDLRRIGRVGGKTILFYLMTTAAAITMALVAAILIGPGRGFELETTEEYSAAEAPSFVDVVVDLFPQNIVAAAANAEILPVIVFSLLFGMAMTMAGQAGARVLSFFQDLMEVVMKLVTLVMWMAPVGVFALIAQVFATTGFEALQPLLLYVSLVIVVLVVQGFVVYPLLLKCLGGLNPQRFLSKMWPVQIFAFSTASSAATIPVTLRAVEKRLGVDNSVASFTVPLGATINMDGTAIMQGVATVFLAQAYGVQLGVTEYLMVILTATLASVGTAGVPGAGLIMLAMVLRQVGLPVEGIAIILGFDRILDMVRTAVNVTGDAAVSCIVGKSENALDADVFNSREAETATT